MDDGTLEKARNLMKGFSLIELMTAIAVLMLLSALAMGLNHAFYSRNELQTLKDELTTAVHYARAQSMVSGKKLSLENLAGTDDWSSGMVLYELKKDGGKRLLHTWQWHHPHWQVHWSGFSSKRAIPFSPHPHLAAMNGQFRLSNERTQQQMVILVNRLGRLRTCEQSPKEVA